MSLSYADLGAALLVPWVLPVIGTVTGAAAYYVGRRLLGVKSDEEQESPNPLTEDEALSGVTRDRRAAPRRKGNTVLVELRLDLNQEPFRAWVLNRSVGGLCLLIDRPIAEQAKLQIRPRGRDAAAWTDAVVRSCRKESEQFEVGIQFHRMPSWSELFRFG